MKKLYMMPSIKVVSVQIRNILEQVSIGNAVSNVSADSRRGGADWDDEEE